MITGTSYFVSRNHAFAYYKRQNVMRRDVETKIANGEIQIGKPDLKPGQRLTLIDNGTRYAIED